MAVKVFVYGTLMQNRSNHHFLHHQTFLNRAVVNDIALYNVTLYYPGAVHKANRKICGEIYIVDEKTLKSLDELEDNGNLYRREIFSAVLENGETVDAWVYLWLSPVQPESEVHLNEQPW